MLDWSQIEKYYDQGTTSGFALALMESEKLFREVLDQKKIPGDDVDEQAKNIEPFLSSPQSFEHARHLTNQLIDLNLPKNIGKQTTEQVLRVYFTAITEASEISSLDVGKLRFQYHSHKVQRGVLKFLSYLLGLTIVVVALSLLIADTESGLIAAQKIVEFSRTAVYRWLPIALAVFTFIVIGIGISLKRKSRHITSKEKETETAEAE